MPRSLHSGSIVPRGLIVDHIEAGPGLTIIARPVAASARCPNCDQPSSRVQTPFLDADHTLGRRPPWSARRPLASPFCRSTPALGQIEQV